MPSLHSLDPLRCNLNRSGLHFERETERSRGMLHCSSTSYSQTFYLFYTFTRVQILYFSLSFFFFHSVYVLLRHSSGELYHLSILTSSHLFIVKIALFHSPLSSLVHIIGLLSPFIINSVLIIRERNFTRLDLSFLFDFIIIIIILFFFDERTTCHHYRYFIFQFTLTRIEKFPNILYFFSVLSNHTKFLV